MRRSQRGGSTAAPSLPLRRIDAQVAYSEEGMGSRETTNMFLASHPAAVRVPAVRPDAIMGRWASVTTTECFPAADYPATVATPPSQTPLLVSPATNLMSSLSPSAAGIFDGVPPRHDDLEDHMDAMEKHLSDLMMDPTAEEEEAHSVPTPPHTPAASHNDRGRHLPPSQPLLKRISEHRPSVLFPPPPPPVTDGDVVDAVVRRRMMRWYQITEMWCVERIAVASSGPSPHQTLTEEVEDRERAIAAPPPRPPMFSENVAPSLEQRRFLADVCVPHAPYSIERWVFLCLRWWPYISAIFDQLRDLQRFEGMRHVCREAPSFIWAPAAVEHMIA